MTKTYAITGKQRDGWLAIMRKNIENPDAYDAIAELETLPLITGEPVGQLFASTGGATVFAGWEAMCKMPAGTKFYTHPPAPRKITADDDVQLMAFNDCPDDWNSLECRKSWLEGYIEGANAVIKHKGDTK